MISQKVKILNVDDDEAKRYTVSRILKKEGFIVHEATSGEEALRKAALERPDLIVLDVNMPDLNGFEVCRRLKADPQTATIAILHLSATYIRSENKAHGLDAGADGYLTQEVEPAELLATIRAILRIKEAEEKAQTLACQWQATFDAISDAVCLLDSARTVVRCNAAFAELVRRPAHEILHSRSADLLTCVLGAADFPALDTVFAEHRRVVVELQAGDRWLRVTADPVSQTPGTLAGAVCLLSDITERKTVEELRQSLLVRARERTAQLQELAAIATRLTAAHDLESVLRVVTEEARRLIPAHQSASSVTVDQNLSQAIGTASLSDKYASWHGSTPEPAGSEIYSLVCRINRPVRMTQAELESHPVWKAFEDNAGKRPPMRGWLAAPFLTRDGQNLGLLQLSDKVEGEFTEDDEAILVQLAQMASAALESARLVQELRQRDRQKDEFLAMLAHELRNPLAPIRNALHLVRLATRHPQAEVQLAHEVMERQVEHLVRLVDDFLDVSRITRGKVSLQMERVDLASVVARAIEGSRPLIDARKHTLNVALPAEALPVEADEVRLAQVFLNLLNNAAKYTPEGGQIWLTVTKLTASLPLSPDAGSAEVAVVRVRDTGMGIPAGMLPKVFDLFTQAERTLDRAEGGLGIGLTLVRRLAEMHNGTVEATSDGPGLGSEFVVRLPLLAEATVPYPTKAAGAVRRTAPAQRILVVDDNRDSAESLAMLLKLFGHDARTAHDGRQALAVAGAYQPHIILLDIGLPGMDGYEVAREMRAMPALAKTVLVALTGYGAEDHRRQARDAGFNAHLVKPVKFDDLQALLARSELASQAPVP